MAWGGIERELSAGAPSQGALGRLLSAVGRRVPHLPGVLSQGIFTTFGRVYIDAGGHPEISSIEAECPDDVLRSVLAGEAVLREAAAHEQIELYRHNVDYLGSTWGSHFNFACRREPARKVMYSQLVPLLLSQVILGCGGLAPTKPGIEFSLSPRSSGFILKPISSSSNCDRGLCHTRDEPLAEKTWRAHISSAETTLTHWSTWLRFASTSLVIDAIEGGARPAEKINLVDPLDAMRSFAADPTCKVKAPTADASLSAIDIQRIYLAAVRSRMETGPLPDWARLACQRWERTLEMLEADPLQVTFIDWCVKFKLFTDWAAAQHGFDWGDVNRPRSGRVRDLRDELIEMDLLFGRLHPPGLFDQLDAMRACDHRIPELSDVAEQPFMPRSGRAAVRAREIERLSGTRGARCEWDEVQDGKGRIMYLPDVDTCDAAWSEEKPFDLLRRLRLI